MTCSLTIDSRTVTVLESLRESMEGESIVGAVRNVLPRTPGQVLCFLPGAREIERAGAELMSATEGI